MRAIGLAACWLLLGCLSIGRAQSADDDPVYVALETSLGTLVVAVDTARAPLAGNYFLGYVDRGQYDGATLYRQASLDGGADPQIVQGGILLAALTATGPVDIARHGGAYLPDFEPTGQVGLRHQRGTVSLARDLLYTGQVIPEIVISLRAVPSMDEGGSLRPDARGFPIIGQVVSGMAVVDEVARRERAGATTIDFLRGQVLTEPVRIGRAVRVAGPGSPISLQQEGRR